MNQSRLAGFVTLSSLEEFILFDSDPWVEKKNQSVSLGLAPFTKPTPGPGEGQARVLL